MSTSTSSSPSDLLLLLQTAQFASLAHASQVRKNHQRTPYINHPLDVARRLADRGSSLHHHQPEGEGAPVWVLQAALLHDVVEDTEVSYVIAEGEEGGARANS